MVLQHLRALRRDQYRCQYRPVGGIRCLEPAGQTRIVDGALVAVCKAHR